MRPTLRQLEYIVAVAEMGQVGLAADTLNVSQPSLSSQLLQAEQELGATIFIRGRGGAKVTSEGENIVRRARLILRDHEDLRASAKSGGLFHGRLRLGTLPSIGPYLLPEVVRRLHKNCPNFRLVVREENTRDLDQGLRNGRLDMIICTPEDHPSMNHTPLFEEEFLVATALNYLQESQTESLELSDLQGQTFLTLGPKHRFSQMVAMLASRAGGRVSDEYEATSLDAIRLMAASGAGIAILPQIYAMTEARRTKDVLIRHLNDPDARRSIVLIQPHTAEPRADSSALAEVLLSAKRHLLMRPTG